MQSPFWQFFQDFKTHSSMPLSIDEYFYFLTALEDNRISESIKDIDDLRQFCKLFWLKGDKEEFLFNKLFDSYIKQWTEYFENITPEPLPVEPKSIDTPPAPLPQKSEKKEPIDLSQEKEKTTAKKTVESDKYVDFELIISDTLGAGYDNDFEIVHHTYTLNDQAFMPFELRRFSQRLRRRVETFHYTNTERLNLPPMIKQFNNHGFIENILYERKSASDSNVVLLADRHGSMLAYENWEKQLAKAIEEIPLCRFEHFHFYNLPQLDKTKNHYLFKYVNHFKTLNTKKNNWTKDTWFIIFSDAGAHSGLVNEPRIRQSLKLCTYLNNISNHVHWLNPVPLEFQNDCTSKRLMFSIPMVYPDTKGLDEITKKKQNV